MLTNVLASIVYLIVLLHMAQVPIGAGVFTFQKPLFFGDISIELPFYQI